MILCVLYSKYTVIEDYYMSGMPKKKFEIRTHTGGIDASKVALHAERLSLKGFSKRQFVLGIDIGGQTIKPELYEAVNGVLSEKPVFSLTGNPITVKGLEGHKNQIAEIIMQAKHYAEDTKELNGKLVGVGIAAPGRIMDDSTVKPDAFPNLRLKPDEFDGKNLKAEYIAAIRDWDVSLAKEMETSLSVANDAKSMFSGMLDAAKQQKPGDIALFTGLNGNSMQPGALGGKRVAMFGIGTGLGHCIADMDPNGSMKGFVTDGHGSELLLKVDKGEDERMLLDGIEALKSRHLAQHGESLHVPVFDIDGHKAVRAEMFICDPMLKAMSKVDDAKDIKLDGSNKQHQAVIDFAGKYMARLIKTIRQQEGYDISDHLRSIGQNDAPKSSWSAQEMQQAAATNVYVMGGGVGSKQLGAAIAKVADDALKKDGIDDITFAQFRGADNPAPRAAASLVPTNNYRQIGA